MVDGITPNLDFDPSKPAAQRYVKRAPRSKAPSSSTNKPDQQPSFGKNTYAASDAKERAARQVDAHSNQKGSQSRLKNAPKSIDGLEDPGSFAARAGEQKMPSTSVRGKSAIPINAAPKGSGSITPSVQAPSGLSPAMNSLPARDTAPERSGEGTGEGLGSSTSSGGSNMEEASSNGSSGPDKMAKANEMARAKDAENVDDAENGAAENLEDKLPAKDPTRKLQDKAIGLVLGDGNAGKLAKKILANPMVRSALVVLAPWCCGFCAVIVLTLVMYLVLQSSFFGRLYLNFILPS